MTHTRYCPRCNHIIYYEVDYASIRRMCRGCRYSFRFDCTTEKPKEREPEAPTHKLSQFSELSTQLHKDLVYARMAIKDAMEVLGQLNDPGTPEDVAYKKLENANSRLYFWLR